MPRKAPGTGIKKTTRNCAGTAGDYSTTFAADGKGRGHIYPVYPVTTRGSGREEDSKETRTKNDPEAVARWLCSGLAAGFDDQNHAGVEHGYVAVVALEGGDGGLVGGGNRVESFAAFHGVAKNSGLSGSTCS